MNEYDQKVYAEVFEILGYMDRNIIIKTPIEVIEYIKRNKKEKYISRIDKNDIFNKENIEEKTLCILAWMNLNYWADSEKRKELIQKYSENDIKYENKLKEQYEGKYIEFRKNE